MILVTRPGDPGQRLVGRLETLGQATLWWPAFDLLPPSDPRALRASIERLAGYDLVVFVSPMAVRACAGAMGAVAWPDGVRIAGVGGATLRAVDRELAVGPGVPRFGPAGTEIAAGGAEALWETLRALPCPARRVLIVRAQSGRDWLGGQLRAAGADVDEIEAYRRCPHRPLEADWARLRAALQGGAGQPVRLAVLFSSTEAVAVVTPALAREAWIDLPRALALCVHERIERAARDAGWREVRPCEPQAEAMLAALAGAASGSPATRPRAPTG